MIVRPLYESALKESGYDFPMEYKTNQGGRTITNRNRKVIWFNPPFSSSVKTPIGKIFLQLIKKHFPRHNKLHKIFNTNTLKLSYSCMPNVVNIIKQHNSKALKGTVSTPARCNCIDKPNCPLPGKCLTECIVYRATATSQEGERTYFGTCEGPFKPRYNNHTLSFRDRNYEKDTELSKYLWSLFDKGIGYSIKWDVETYCSPYKCGTRKCDLCLTEKCKIVQSDPKKTLNSRNELLSKCRHRNKFSLKCFK